MCIYLLDTSAPFLETEAGAPYVPVFRAVRYRHILNDHSSVGNVEGDRIVPTSEYLLACMLCVVISSVAIILGRQAGLCLSTGSSG